MTYTPAMLAYLRRVSQDIPDLDINALLSDCKGLKDTDEFDEID